MYHTKVQNLVIFMAFNLLNIVEIDSYILTMSTLEWNKLWNNTHKLTLNVRQYITSFCVYIPIHLRRIHFVFPSAESWRWSIILSKDGVQPKTPPFSTRHLIWVNYKVVSQWSQPILLSITYLNGARHNLVIELCRALFKYENERKMGWYNWLTTL